MIKSTSAYKISLIVQNLNAKKINAQLIVTLSPRNKSDSINEKGSHMKFDPQKGEYYLEIMEGTKISHNKDAINIRIIDKLPKEKELLKREVLKKTELALEIAMRIMSQPSKEYDLKRQIIKQVQELAFE